MRRPKLCFGPEKLINSILFAAGGNNTIELVSNRTAKVDFFANLILKPSIIRKIPVFFRIIEGKAVVKIHYIDLFW